jgi:diguanylate cyclase
LTEQKSPLEAWTQLARNHEDRAGITGYVPLLLSAAGALGVTPFAVMRWLTRDWIVAIIDTAIVAGFVFLGTYVYRTHNVRVANIAIALLCIAGALATVYLRGIPQIYWVYPAVMATFYLLKPHEAIALTLTVTAILLPELIRNTDTFLTSTVVITILVTSVFAFAFSVINNRQQQRLLDLATKDPLTGAGNRRALEEKLAEVTASFRRSGHPTSLILIDLDHFKKVNDVHGHAVGDDILKRITEILNLRIRVTDRLYRIGGEEFVVVADEQNIESAARLAEQLRTLVEVNELVPDSAVTISLGIAELRADESHESWLQRADEALYQAKRGGRNTVRSAA